MEIDEEVEQDIKLGAIQKHILPKDGMMSNPVSSAHNFLHNCLLSSVSITLVILMCGYSFTWISNYEFRWELEIWTKMAIQ